MSNLKDVFEERMTKIKIRCHSCNGKGYLEDFTYPETKLVKIVCPECDGKKYVEFEQWIETKVPSTEAKQ